MQPTMKPTAQALASQGRYGDSTLVHMTPGEVAGLQYLAMKQGGSLTVNPKTGLPEAFFLAPLLGLLGSSLTAGTALAPLFATPVAAGLTTGGITALATGSLEAGLSAGLGAFGGAGLSEGLLAAGGAGGATAGVGGIADLAAAAPTAAADVAASSASGALPTATGTMQQLATAPQATQSLLAAPGGVGGGFAGQGITAPTGAGFNLGSAAPTITDTGAQLAPGAVQGSTGLVPGAPSFAGTPGIVTQAAGGVGGMPGQGGGIGVDPSMQLAQQTGIQTADAAMSPLERMGSGISNLLQGKGGSRGKFMDAVGGPMGLISKGASVAAPFFAKDKKEEGLKKPETRIRPYAFDFRGPETQEGFQYRTGAPGESTAEQRYFTPTFTPMGSFEAGTEPGPSFYGTPTPAQYAQYSSPRGETEDKAVYAGGGIASLRENDFILPADVISHMGNGSSDAGMEIAITKFKARPIKGDGDGMSDSIPTDIEGKQKALVANEEALIPREMVAFLGGGSVEKGAEKLEKFMTRVRKARTGKTKQAPEIDVSRYMPA
jgi:hypothetical protein